MNQMSHTFTEDYYYYYYYSTLRTKVDILKIWKCYRWQSRLFYFVAQAGCSFVRLRCSCGITVYFIWLNPTVSSNLNPDKTCQIQNNSPQRSLNLIKKSSDVNTTKLILIMKKDLKLLDYQMFKITVKHTAAMLPHEAVIFVLLC